MQLIRPVAVFMLLAVAVIGVSSQASPSEMGEAEQECAGGVRPQKTKAMLQKKKNSQIVGRRVMDVEHVSTAMSTSQPGSFSYVLKSDGEKQRCHNDFRTTTWGDLGRDYDEKSCQDACSAAEGCKWVALQSNGWCTSYTGCDRSQKNRNNLVTWEKVPASEPGTPATPVPATPEPATPVPATPVPATPVPAPVLTDSSFSYVLKSDGDKQRCHNDFRTTTWGDLGRDYDEKSCQDACSAAEGCKWVALQSNGWCTSYTGCDRSQNNRNNLVTWEKVPASEPETPVPATPVPATPEPATPVPATPVPATPVPAPTGPDVNFPLGAEDGCNSACKDLLASSSHEDACAEDDCAQCNLCPSTFLCLPWCGLAQCDLEYCQGCSQCAASLGGRKQCKRGCSLPNPNGPTSWLTRCELLDCSGCAFCPRVLTYPQEVVNSPEEGSYIELSLGTRQLCFESGCAHVRSYQYTPSSVRRARKLRASLTKLQANPTIRVKPGEILKIRYHNGLGADSPGPHETGLDGTGSYVAWLNHTNIHTHGLHVSGRRGQDHVLTHIAPGETEEYNIQLPADHMGGLHWYHDHTHHATSMHLGEGLCGMIVVDDEEGAIPDAIKNMREHLMMITMLNMPHVKHLSKLGHNGLKLHEVADETNHVYVNGIPEPTVVMKPGEWNRFRMVFASIEQQLEVYLEDNPSNNLPMAQCELQLLAKDGIYLQEMPRPVTVLHFFAGARSDVAIRCNCDHPPCSAALVSRDSGIWIYNAARPDGPPVYNNILLEMEIAGSPVTSTDLLPVVVNRPCYLADLRKANVAQENKHRFEMRRVSYPPRSRRGLKWNSNDWYYLGHDMPENEHDLEETALGKVPPGSVIEVRVQGVYHHPFHVHINSFQLMSFTAVNPTEHPLNVYYRAGDWHDVIMHPTVATIIRFQTDRFTGEQVIHCHLLEHEDEGMMGWLWITGEDGQEFDGSEDLEPTCYRPSNTNRPGWRSV